MKIRVYNMENIVQIVVIIFVFLYLPCVCQTGKDLVTNSVRWLEEFTVSYVDNKWFTSHHSHPVFNNKSHLLDGYIWRIT
jgi:hypothetical protein